VSDNEGLRVTSRAKLVNILPDVCLTPPSNLPVPYQIYGTFAEGVRFEETVRMTNMHVMTTQSRLPTVHGDEPGTTGGILSGVNKGWCRSITYSKNVRAKRNNITFHTSYYWMNCNGPDGAGNTIGIAIYVETMNTARIGSDGAIEGDTNPAPKDSTDLQLPNTQTEPPVDKLFPKVTYDLDLLPPIPLPPIFGPNATILNKLKLKGTVSLQREGSINPASFSKEGYEIEAANEFGQFTGSFSVSKEYGGGFPSISSGITGPYNSTSMKFTPPNTFTYSYSPKAIEKSVNGWKISGNVGMEIESNVIPRPNLPKLEPVPVPDSQPVYKVDPEPERWKIIVGGLIIVGTIVEDFLTAGAGTADDGPSISAGLVLIRAGL